MRISLSPHSRIETIRRAKKLAVPFFARIFIVRSPNVWIERINKQEYECHERHACTLLLAR